MKVAVASTKWGRPNSAYFTHARGVVLAGRTAGVDAYGLTLHSRGGERIGGMIAPLVQSFLSRYPVEPDTIVHNIDPLVWHDPDVITVHDLMMFTQVPLTDLYRWHVLHAMSMARRIVVTTDYTRRGCLARFSRRITDKIGVVPVPHEPTDPGRLEPEFDALWIGRDRPWKHLDAFIGLVARRPDLKFALRWTYDPNDSASFFAQRWLYEEPSWRHGLENLTILPEMSDHDLDVLYRRSRVVVSTSSDEGWHAAITEGYVRGCQVVLPRVEPYVSIFSDSAPNWYVPDRSGDALVDALEAALTTDSMFDRDFVRRISYPAVGQQLRAIYEELVRS